MPFYRNCRIEDVQRPLHDGAHSSVKSPDAASQGAEGLLGRLGSCRYGPRHAHHSAHSYEVDPAAHQFACGAYTNETDSHD